MTHADKGKTQDEDIVHAYNLIHSVISDIAIFQRDIEKDFHDWFMDASRIGSELGIVLTVPRLSGRQQHRANAEIIYKGIGNEPTFHALERAIRTCTRTHNQQMYACTQIGQLSL